MNKPFHREAREERKEKRFSFAFLAVLAVKEVLC